MKYYPLVYSLKVWLTSVLLAPIIVFTIESLDSIKAKDFSLSFLWTSLQLYFAFILLGSILSIITWLIYWLTSILTYQYTTNIVHRKLIMSLMGAVLTVLTFLLFFSSGDIFNGFPIAIMASYGFCIVGGSLIYSFGVNEIK
jgi:hypothetical protein